MTTTSTPPLTMKAAHYSRYGTPDVLTISDEYPVPEATGDTVRVRVQAMAINPKDTFVRKGRFKLFSGYHFPKQTGADFAGIVDAAGADVTRLNVGDRVYGHLGTLEGGTAAQYITIAESECAVMPETLDFIEAAGVSLVGQTALQALRDIGHISNNMRVCINGASGGVGSIAVQIASIYDAHITTISSKRNVDFCQSLGAQTARSYEQTDIHNSTDVFDIIFDVFGNLSYQTMRSLLADDGVFISTVPSPAIILQQAWTKFFGRTRAALVVVQSRSDDLNLLRTWIDEGQLRPIVDSVYPLRDIAAAHAKQQTKHARGKIIVTIP